MATEKWKAENQDRMRQYRRDWYRRNSESQIRKAMEGRKALRRWVNDIKSDRGCSTPGCDEKHPACLDFHHRDPSQKESSINKAVEKNWSKERLLDEMAKCDLLCSNCHRKMHAPDADGRPSVSKTD